MTTITYGELQHALEEAEGSEPVRADGLSTKQWAAEWGKGLTTARGIIKQALDAGMMVSATVITRSMDGKNVPVKVYRMVDKENECEQKT